MMIYTYDSIRQHLVSLYVSVDRQHKLYLASLRDSQGNIYIIDLNTTNEQLNTINELIKRSVIVGSNLKGPDGDLNKLLNIMQGSPFSNKPKNWYTAFTYLDINEFIASPMLVGASLGMNINMERDEVSNSIVYHDIIFKCYDVFKDDITVKLAFQESDGFDFVKCLKTKTTKLTAEAIYNGDTSEPSRDKFAPKEDLLNYFKLMIPNQLISMYTNHYDDELRDMLVDKKYSGWFKNVVADNLMQWGIGGAHSIHVKYNMYNSKDPRWNGWVLLHIDGDSFYPNLMIKLMTMSRKMNREKFIGYTEDRARLKHSKDAENIAEMVRLLKVKINAMYGLSGSKQNVLYDPSKQFDTVAHGQMIIVSLAQHLCNIGAIIFQTNTDGLYAVIEESKLNDVRVIREYLTSLTGINYDEDRVNILYQKNVNNYVKIYVNGKTEVKGKELCGDYNNSYTKSKEFAIVHKAVYEQLINGVPIAQTIRNTTAHDISWYVSNVYIANANSIRLVNVNEVTYKGGQLNGTSTVNRINKKSANVTNYQELYTFKGDIVRLIPTKCYDQKIGIVTENAKTGKLERTKRNLTGDNPVILLNELSSYNINDFDIDFEFLEKLANDRVNELVDYESEYNSTKRINKRKMYGMRG